MRTRLFRVPFVDNRRCDISLIAKEICMGTDETCDGSTGFLNGPATYEMDASDQDDEFDLGNLDICWTMNKCEQPRVVRVSSFSSVQPNEPLLPIGGLVLQQLRPSG